MKKLLVLCFAVALAFVFATPQISLAQPKSKSICFTLFSKANYKGEHKTICKNAKDLKEFKFDNKTKSIKTTGAAINVYAEKNYKGDSFFVNGNHGIPLFTIFSISSVKYYQK